MIPKEVVGYAQSSPVLNALYLKNLAETNIQSHLTYSPTGFIGWFPVTQALEPIF